MTIGLGKTPANRVWAKQFTEGLRGLALGDCVEFDSDGNCVADDSTSTLLTGGVTPITTSPVNTLPTSVSVTSDLTPSEISFLNGGSVPIVNTQTGAINWNNVLPGLFSSVEKIAVQTTQPVGTSTTSCNPITGVCTTSQTVLPAGATSLAASGLGSILPLLLIAGVAFMVMEK
jgi:hypothetical protein